MSAPAASMFTPAAQQLAREMGLLMGKANLDVFSETLLRLAKEDERILAVTSDSRGSGKLLSFAGALPKQLVEVGIAEQNLVGIAAGLASCGKRPFAVSPACFLTSRSFEQIKVDVCYSDNAVALIGISAGVSYGALGSTHHSLHDFAALRAIQNLEIIAPADNFETREAIRYAAGVRGPVYIRFGKAPTYSLPDESFSAGSARMVRDGTDLTFIATGETVIHALLAAECLSRQGVSCRVLSMHTVKPLDTEALRKCARDTRGIITVEEHLTHGGLGEACAAYLLGAGFAVRFRMVALPDEYTVTGSQADIFRHYGISMEGLSTVARSLL